MFWSSVAHASSLMPVQGATFSHKVDDLYRFLVYASFISSVLVIGGMMYFAFKYRRRGQTTAYISHSAALEFLWSFIPFVIFMLVFGWGWWVYHDLRTPPKGAFEVTAVGSKWEWNFMYKSGRTSPGVLTVPVNTPVRVIIKSVDVIHSFYVPAFRVKQDAVPGRYTQLWFEANKLGEFKLFCAEYCGEGHSKMLGKINVVTQDEFDEWMLKTPDSDMPLAELGQKAFETRCTVCHNITAEKKVGPGILGLFGKTREFESGESVTADENYIRESVLNPSKKIVKGFPNAMTPFQGLISERELDGIIEFIKTLK